MALAVPLLALTVAAPLEARPSQCDTRIDGEPVTIFHDSEDASWSSMRDRLFTRGRSCPASVVITYLLPDLTAAEREVFCANFDPETGSHSLPAQGPRDAYGRCMEPSRTCQLVNATRETALDLMGIGRQAEGGAPASGLSATISAVTHWSGAMILSGNAASITNLLSSAGATVGTALGTPAVLAGAAASVVVIGGAVWLCSDDD
jgi:hypothetical protein